MIDRLLQICGPSGCIRKLLCIRLARSSATVDPENNMLVSIRKGRPDIICDFASNTLAMVTVKDDSRQRTRWKMPCEDSTNRLIYPVNISTTEEGP